MTITTAQAGQQADAIFNELELVLTDPESSLSPGAVRAIKYVRAAVSSLSAGGATPSQAWQPIETAPKDGSEVLLAEGDYVCTGFWHDGSECHGHRGGAGWFSEDDRHNLLIASNIHPAHWMPLPAAPGATSPTEGGVRVPRPERDELLEALTSARKLLERCGPHLQGVEQECCGNYESDYGGEYMGQREVVPVCCGQAIDLSDHVANELRVIDAVISQANANGLSLSTEAPQGGSNHG